MAQIWRWIVKQTMMGLNFGVSKIIPTTHGSTIGE
jgi:hypothetical protein